MMPLTKLSWLSLSNIALARCLQSCQECLIGPISKVTNRTSPPHVHVDRDKASCKVWLSPVDLASSLGFKANELGDVEWLVSSNRTILLETW